MEEEPPSHPNTVIAPPPSTQHQLSFTMNNLIMSQYELHGAATCIMRRLIAHTEMMEERERETLALQPVYILEGSF